MHKSKNRKFVIGSSSQTQHLFKRWARPPSAKSQHTKPFSLNTVFRCTGQTLTSACLSLSRPQLVWPHQPNAYMPVCMPGGLLLLLGTSRGHSGPLYCLWKERFIKTRVNSVEKEALLWSNLPGEERAFSHAQILEVQNKDGSSFLCTDTTPKSYYIRTITFNSNKNANTLCVT